MTSDRSSLVDVTRPSVFCIMLVHVQVADVTSGRYVNSEATDGRDVSAEWRDVRVASQTTF